MMEDIYDTKFNSAYTSLSTCRVLQDKCPSVWAANEFVDEFNCVEKLETLPKTTVNSGGLRVVDGNSTGCRNLHASMAYVRPEIHCERLSFIPMEDSNGKTKCSESNDFFQEDFFSEKDLAHFQRTALENGLDSESLFRGHKLWNLLLCSNRGKRLSERRE